MEQGREYYSWEDFDKDSREIADWAKDKGFKNVYGIPRGGLVPAVKLSHLLELPQILSKEDISPETLVIDDIVDTGETLERLYNCVGKNIKVASLWFNPKSSEGVDFFIRKKEQWVVFPWETDESSKYDHTNF